MVQRISIVEVSPRDGLQNEDRLLSTEAKLELIGRCIDAGARRIEATSFVHPDRVPQMADAEQVMAGVERVDGVSYAGLVLNERGYDRAIEAGVDEINFVVLATDTFGRRNQGTTVDEAIAIWERLGPRARADGVVATVTIGASFGCPFEGEVATEQVRAIGERLAGIGVDELSLADTIGVGTPDDVTRKVEAVGEVAPDVVLRCHFHNTRNTGIANVYAAALAGVTVVDSSLGGIGGCPFAPAATGNVPTEDVVYLLHRSGHETGIDLERILPSVPWIAGQLGSEVPGLLAKAGIFPPPS
jgi:hydroxymethylglutaryl-CoA lyase